MCSSLRMKPSSLRPPQQALAGALQEERGDLFFTTSVENRESPLYIGQYPGTRTSAPIREARGRPLRAWAREGSGHPSSFSCSSRTFLLTVSRHGVGTLGTFRCKTQAISLYSVLTVNTALTPPQRPLRASLTSSVAILMVVGTGKTVQAILVAVFPVLML